MKTRILSFLLLLPTVPLLAQFQLKVGVQPGLPLGAMSDSYSFTIGGELTVQYCITEQVAVGVTSGFHHFFEKDWGSTYDGVSANLIPVRASFMYYLEPPGGMRPYVGAEAGIHINLLSYSYRYYYSPYYGYSWGVRDYSDAEFGMAPVVGVELGSGSVAFDVRGQYTMLFDADISYISASVGAIIRL